MKTVIFGGSFDPPHIGHVLTVTYLRSLGYRVLVVPSINHAFKTNVASFNDRFIMCKEAFSWMGEDIEVTDVERFLQAHKINQPVYTIDVVRHFAMTENDLTIAIGTDLLDELPKWHEFKELCKLVTFLVIYRKGYDPSRIDPVFYENEDLKIIDYADFKFPEISSTNIRQCINQEWIPRFVPKSVLQYIKDKGSYAIRKD